MQSEGFFAKFDAAEKFDTPNCYFRHFREQAMRAKVNSHIFDTSTGPAECASLFTRVSHPRTSYASPHASDALHRRCR